MRCLNFRLRVPVEDAGGTVNKVRRGRLRRCRFDGVRSSRQSHVQVLLSLTFLGAFKADKEGAGKLIIIKNKSMIVGANQTELRLMSGYWSQID